MAATTHVPKRGHHVTHNIVEGHTQHHSSKRPHHSIHHRRTTTATTTPMPKIVEKYIDEKFLDEKEKGYHGKNELEPSKIKHGDEERFQNGN